MIWLYAIHMRVVDKEKKTVTFVVVVKSLRHTVRLQRVFFVVFRFLCRFDFFFLFYLFLLSKNKASIAVTMVFALKIRSETEEGVETK